MLKITGAVLWIAPVEKSATFIGCFQTGCFAPGYNRND
jgi:hypothetical protein